MTLEEARKRGLRAVRKPYWAFEHDRLELQKVGVDSEGNALYGPWGTLMSPDSAKALGDAYGQQTILIAVDTADDWVEYPELRW